MRKLVLTVLVIALALPACGGAPPAPPAVATVDAPKTPGTACIATANAERDAKAKGPEKITARHVLVKWSGSKRAPASITRTREQACLRAIEARDKVRGGADFADVVKEYSDEAGAATRGGTVGTIERGDVAPAFAAAAFELERNQLSDVVETEFGFHVIFRTE
jgi:parvulin-like peptidyl-prolyl isomerase